MNILVLLASCGLAYLIVSVGFGLILGRFQYTGKGHDNEHSNN